MGLNNQERSKKSPRIVNWIYTAVVKPILLYGGVLWWTALHKQCTWLP